MNLRTVLCPIDFTPLSDRVLEVATALAPRFGARLVLEHNLDPRPPTYLSVTWMWSEEQKAADEEHTRSDEQRLREMLGRLPAGIGREARLTRGPVDLGLLHLAKSLPADLIVMASHGRSTAAHHSLTEEIIVRAPCPVLVTPGENGAAAFVHPFGEAAPSPAPAIVPVDFSEHGRAAVRHALALAGALPLTLHLVHVERGRPGPAAEEEALRRLALLVPAEWRDRVRLLVRPGEPADEILRAAEEVGAALVVMGCHPKGIFQRFFRGATACDVLHRSRWPVWYVPAGIGIPEAAAGPTAGVTA